MRPDFRNLLVLLFVMNGSLVDPSFAADRAEPRAIDVLSGHWYVFDPKFSVGAFACRIDLSKTATETYPEARSAHCAFPFNSAARWGYENGRLRILDRDGKEIADLGGSVTRLSGALGGAPGEVILEKVDAASDAKGIKTAIAQFGCVFHGYTQDCSLPEPEAADPGRIEGRRVRTLTKLNVRAHPGLKAKIVGYIDKDVELSTDYCLRTSAEIWCKATFGDKSGWMTSIALREGKWAVRTLAFLGNDAG